MSDYSYHYLLLSNHMMLQKKLYTSIKDSGLSIGQPKVLDYLREHDGSTQKELALGCHIEPATLTSLLVRMEKQHLIRRKNVGGNRRSLHVYLTKQGKEQADLVLKAFYDLENEIFEGISKEEREQFLETFTKIYDNMRK